MATEALLNTQWRITTLLKAVKVEEFYCSTCTKLKEGKLLLARMNWPVRSRQQ